MAVVYLDPEDEITSAVSRLRKLDGGSVVVVLPAGSRIATSRINFRLLAREARRRELKLAMVSDEPGVRAIAVAAGLPAYESVDAAQEALGRGEVGEDVTTQTAVVPVVVEPATVAAPVTAPPQPARPPKFGGRLSVEPPLYEMGDLSDSSAPGRRRRAPWFVAPAAAGLLLLILVSLGLYAAYLFVPTATVTLTPKLIEVGPLATTVTADPRVAVVDITAGLIPATQVEVPIQVSGTFAATGSEITLTAATGRVRFTSENTVFEVPVPAGTVVSTANGIEFETIDSVTVPRANFDTQTPGTVMAGVIARERGVKGNVPAGAIKRVPASLDSALVRVRNPQPTSGGSRVEESVITQADYDAALGALTPMLEPALTAAISDPAITPHGLTLYPATALLGPPEPDRQPTDLIDTHAESFTLTLTSNATVLAVNEALADEVATAQLQQQVPAGTTLLPSTIRASHGPGVVFGGTIRFNASAEGQSWRPPDQGELLGQLSGRSVTEARTIMEQYGTVDIAIWPDFIDRLPEQNRIRLTVVPPQETP